MTDITLPDGTNAVQSSDHQPLRIRNPGEVIRNTDDGQSIPNHDVKMFGFVIPFRGDEVACGPFYNYARLTSWSHISDEILEAYEKTFHAPTPLPPGTIVNVRYGNPMLRCGIARAGRINSFGWQDPPLPKNGSFGRGIRAFIYAFVLQSITGWSGFAIAFNTPTVGLGCRSLSYLIYNLASVVTCLLLIASACLFDSWSRQTRVDQPMSKLIAATAFTLRFLGRFLGTANAAFFLLACFLQFLGVWRNCFCQSSYLGLKSSAYISFLSPEKLAVEASVTWGTAAAATAVAIMISSVYFQVNRKPA